MRNTADSTYWSCRLRKRHFREWEVVERVELKTGGMYQVDILHNRKYIVYIQGKYVKKSAADRQSDDRSLLLTLQVLFCYFTPCRTSQSRSQYQLPQPLYLVLFQLRSVGILCRVCRTTRRHTKRAVSHPQLWPTFSPTKSRCSAGIASAMVVLNSTNGSTVGNFKLFV